MFQTQEGEGNLISSSAEAKNMFGFGGIINWAARTICCDGWGVKFPAWLHDEQLF